MEIILEYLNIIKTYIDWRTLFDVPIIAVLFLILYRTLRASGAWSIGAGIIILILLYSFANLFRLSGIVWIFDKISNIALIALIIIFQPEIRKIFERTASTFRIKKILKESGHLSTLITEAVFKLASSKWGAIIIIPGKESLEPKISGGIPLDAAPSIPLIMSIFDHHSPGHDGAMIIENGKIAKFGCRLPLSTSDKLKNEFGTRHHAALGLSEISDALIITVSEERRVITVFNEGKFNFIKTRNDLKDWIDGHWKEGSSFSPVNVFFKNKGSLILESGLSLVLAAVLWLSIIISVSQVKEITATIPVEYKVADRMVIIGDNPESARVKLSGPISIMNMVNPRDLKATIDLTRSPPGEVEVSIARNTIDLPRDVNLLDVEPANYTVKVHSFNQEKLTIKPQLVGSLPEGYKIDSLEITPETLPVLFTTDKDLVEEAFLTTSPIFLQTISQSTKLVCKVIAPQGILPVNSKQWPDVIVTINLWKAEKDDLLQPEPENIPPRKRYVKKKKKKR